MITGKITRETVAGSSSQASKDARKRALMEAKGMKTAMGGTADLATQNRQGINDSFSPPKSVNATRTAGLENELRRNIGASANQTAAGGVAGGDPATLLDDTKARQEKERLAAEQEMRQSKQKALIDARAKANLSSGAFNGANAATESDIARAQDRSSILALSEMDRNNQSEQTQVMRDEAELYDLEDSTGEDINHDGTTGRPDRGDAGLTPKQLLEKKAKKAEDLKQFIADKKAANDTKDVAQGDWDTADGKGGTKEEPLILSDPEYQQMLLDGVKFKTYVYEFNGVRVEEVIDDKGNYFIIEG